MIVKVEDNVVFKNKFPLEIERNALQIKKIEETWNKFVLEHKTDYNGDIFIVTELKSDNNKYTFEIGKAKYADYIYAKQNSDLTILTLFAATLLKTRDDYYLLIRNNNNTINAVGGLAAEQDFKKGVFIPELCLERELKEELGLSLNNKKDVISWEKRYLKIPNKRENAYPCGVLFVTTIGYTKAEFEVYFNKYRSNLDIEVKELLFYTSDTYFDLNYEDKKESYLVELIEMVERDK